MEHYPNAEPMRGARRIDGMKYHIERLTDEELDGIHGHLVGKHVRLVADIAFVETVRFERGQESLPFDDLPPAA